MVKLIYLPDYSHPATITMSAGLFGTASAQPTLQDGFMLTGLQGSADNSQLPQVLGTIISSALGASKSAATGGAAGALPKAGAAAPAAQLAGTIQSQILAPGLYAFTTDEKGLITGVCLAQAFGSIASSTSPPVCGAGLIARVPPGT